MFHKIKAHYHWIVFALLLLTQVIYGGMLNNLNAMFLIPVTNAFGSTRSVFALAVNLRSGGAILSTLVSGVIKRRFGNKQLMTFSILTLSLCFVVCAFSQNMATLCIIFTLMGLCDGFCYLAATSRMASDWFKSHKGLVLGCLTAGTGLGGSLISVILTAVIGATDWRGGFLSLAMIYLGIGLLLLFFLRNKPENLGLKPFMAESHRHKKLKPIHQREWYGPDMKQLIRKPIFWIVLAVLLFNSLSAHVAFHTIIPLFRDRGLDPAQTALLQSVLMLVTAGAKLSAGYICDKIGASKVTFATLLLIIVSLIFLFFARTMPMAVVSTVVLGAGLPIVTILVPLVCRELLGYHSYDGMLGIYLSFGSAGSICANFIANFIFDATGSYDPALLGAAIIAVVSALLLCTVFLLSKKLKKTVRTGVTHLCAREESL